MRAWLSSLDGNLFEKEAKAWERGFQAGDVVAGAASPGTMPAARYIT